MPRSPFLWCPCCGARFVLPDQPPAHFQCPACGPVEFQDLHAPARAYLLAATEAAGEQDADEANEAPTGGAQRAALEVRDESGAVMYRLESAPGDVRSTRPASDIDTHALESVLAQLPQAAFTAMLVGRTSGQFVMQVAPELGAKLSRGAARLMAASSGGFRGNIVDAVTNSVIGQASFAPVSIATLGAAALWQAVSIAVAQKHLHDINIRLRRIEHSVSELRELLDKDLYAELHGDAEHLRGVARTLDVEQDLAARHTAVDEIVRAGRARHIKLRDRIQLVVQKLTPDRTARWFGQSMATAAKDLEKDLDDLGRAVVALRLNTLLLAAAAEMLRRLDAPRYATEIDADVGKVVAGDDAMLDRVYGRVGHAVMAVGAKLRGGSAVASLQAQLAGRVWAGALAASRVRQEVARVRQVVEVSPPRLMLQVDDARKISSVAWLDAARAVSTA